MGTYLRNLRKSRYLTQKDLSEILGVHQTQISRYELGKDRIKEDLLRRAEELLGDKNDY